jgi:hypothetical protein
MTGIGKALAALSCVLLMSCSGSDDAFISAGSRYVEQFHHDVRQGRYAAIYQASSPGLPMPASGNLSTF